MKWITEVQEDIARERQKKAIKQFLTASFKTKTNMTTRAKLVCQSVKPSEYDGVKQGENVSFMTQYNAADAPEDNIYSKFTPSAQFNFSITNPQLYGMFEPGKAYYFDISPVG